MRNRLFVFLLVIFLSCGALRAQVTIYVVRHAEKAAGRNPDLTSAGKKRARALSRVLRSQRLKECYATQFKRTQQTVAPSAARIGRKVKLYRAGGEKEFVKRLLREHQGDTVLVAGHSNTVPGILDHLGIRKPVHLSDSDYDDLFMVQVSREGKAVLIHLHYGAANPRIVDAK